MVFRNLRLIANSRAWASMLMLLAVFYSPNSSKASDRNYVSINDGWQFNIGKQMPGTAVHLPHTWNSDAYETRDYFRGTGYYTRTFIVPESLRDRKVFMKLDGAANSSVISINGEEVGSTTGAYSSHTVDISRFVTPGDTCRLEVAVSNATPSIAPYSADFTFMGGLYRDAWLIGTSGIHMDIVNGAECGFKINTVPGRDGAWNLSAETNIVNTSGKTVNPELRIVMRSNDGKEMARKVKTVRIKHDCSVNTEISLDNLRGLDLWSPENPTLYLVELSLWQGKELLDKAETYVGFRTFGFDEQNRFVLNGKPYKLRGMCRHQDQRPFGIALSDEQHRRDMELIKELGANFIRISHYPQDDAILEMCDRLGIIAWEEIPVIDYVPVRENFADNCEIMLRDMIRRHYNHPSIVMWGYMNEILLRMPGENQDETKRRTLELCKRLNKVLFEEDSSRSSAIAFHGSDVYHGAGLSDVTDVVGWNLYQGWYGGSFPDFEAFLSRQHREHPDHMLIVSEYGAGSDLRLHSLKPEAFDFSMEYQQDYLEHYLPVIEDSAFVAGASHWNFIDFSSANRAESMPHINNKGLLTNDRRKKDVFYYYKAMWHDAAKDTVAHIATRDWERRTELIDESGVVRRPVKVYTNLSSVELRVNGRSLGKRGVTNCSVLFDVPLTPGENVFELYGEDIRLLDVAKVCLRGIRVLGNKLDLGTDELAVNVGSNCYYTSAASSLTWLPDRALAGGAPFGYVGGKATVSQDEIELTDDEPLLQRCLSGLEGYKVNVLPGRYEVELSFADLSAPSALSAYMLGHNAGQGAGGLAAMNVYINGRQVEAAFVPAESSSAKALVKRRYTAEVTDANGIFIEFEPCGDGANTLLSALKIRKL